MSGEAKTRLIELYRRMGELKAKRVELIVLLNHTRRIRDSVRADKARRDLTHIEIEIGELEGQIQAAEFQLLREYLKE
ncbi:MAG TPA: hypothetical protein ENG21_03930, partial [Nitrososphaeria archaeon]|nr:hypothetical protein [Nitrososphaeria archaeon]